MPKKESTAVERIVISPPNFQMARFKIIGTAPYVQNKFSKKAAEQMLQAQQTAGGARGKKKSPRDIQADYRRAMHLDVDGKHGIPASAFRSAMIQACRMTGFQMVKARMSVFIVADTVDAEDDTPLVLLQGTPKMIQSTTRLETGVASISIRPMWEQWSAVVTVRWDADQFKLSDVFHLLLRAGLQVGVGEGRPLSKKSDGMGWGTFDVAESAETGEIA